MRRAFIGVLVKGFRGAKKRAGCAREMVCWY
jgi:hypothetical protein